MDEIEKLAKQLSSLDLGSVTKMPQIDMSWLAEVNVEKAEGNQSLIALGKIANASLASECKKRLIEDIAKFDA